jgi:hypothetical protein
MEWLRAVDLSEYAPNMRGSGMDIDILALASKRLTYDFTL